MAPTHAEQKPEMSKACVYTVLTGDYETLNEQPAAHQSDLRFICLTDNPDLTSDTWEIQQVRPLLAMDPIRSQRDIKIRPYRYLPSWDVTLYIDNSVILRANPQGLFDLFETGKGLATFNHSGRETVLDEFIVVLEQGLDDQNKILEQLNHYMISDPDILKESPIQSSVILRDSGNSKVREAMEIWSAHVFRYSRRDQLSANVAFHTADLDPQLLPIDRSASPFHSWPHAKSRKPRSTGIVAPPPAMLLRQSELNIKKLEREVSELKEEVGALSAKAARADRLKEHLKQAQRFQQRLETIMSSGIVGTRAPEGGWILADPEDDRTNILLERRGNANPNSFSIWSTLLGESAWTHVVDVGANYGEMLLGGSLPETAEIIAVEPNPRVRRYLTRSLAAAGIKAKIKPIAISDQDGKATFELDLQWSGKSGLAPTVDQRDPGRTRRIRVRTRLLSRLFGRNAEPEHIKALIKIDVEGSERPILAGSLSFLQNLHEVAIMIEVLHMEETDLDWIVQNFAVELFDPEQNELHAVSPTSGAELKTSLDTDRFYSQDLVLRTKPTA